MARDPIVWRLRAGKIKHSLILHPNDAHIIYPLGSTIVVKNVENTDEQFFLQGEPATARSRAFGPQRPLARAQAGARRGTPVQ